MKISLHKNSTEKFCKKHFCKIKKIELELIEKVMNFIFCIEF